MQIIPVLDLKQGLVVRGVAGRRSEYRPVVSRLTRSPLPIDVARAFRSHYKLSELYVADLDAIEGGRPAWDIYAALRGEGFRLWVDAGIRDSGDAAALADAGLEVLVAGLESLAGPAVLERLCSHFSPGRIAFSLDLKAGEPLAVPGTWQATDAWQIAMRAIACGVGRMIVLDLARVGMAGGPGTEALCRRLAATHPEVELIAGGGIRGRADLERLADCCVSAVLVASALHDGTLIP